MYRMYTVNLFPGTKGKGVLTVDRKCLHHIENLIKGRLKYVISIFNFGGHTCSERGNCDNNIN